MVAKTENRNAPHTRRMHHNRPTAKYKLFTFMLATTLLSGCITHTHYLSFIPIHDGWRIEDTLCFHVDTLRNNSINGIELLLLTDNYPYSNIAFHIQIEQDSISVYNDSISTNLQNNKSIKSIGRRIDFTIPIANLTLCDSTHTTIRLTHLMNVTSIKGIRDIGIRIGSPVQHPDEVVWQVEW